MVWFVLTVGLVNIGLGFFLAVALTEPPPWQSFRLAWLNLAWMSKLPPLALPAVKFPWPLKRAHSGASPVTSTTSHEPDAPSASAAPAAPAELPGFRLEDLPRHWLSTLSAEGITPGSLLEAAGHVMRLEVSQYREQLITAENRAPASLAATDADTLAQLCTDLVTFNQDWLVRQIEAAEMLKRRAGKHGDQEQAAGDLVQVLHDQAAIIQESNTTVAALHYRTEIETGGRRVLERLTQLIDQTHALRDRLNDLLATIIRNSGGLSGISANLQLDQATGLANRLGLELMFPDLWRDDPQRQRQVTAALIDIDRFTRVNQRLGTRIGDHTVAALASLLSETFRRDRGVDRLIRLSGQSFLVLMGDTGPHQGLTAIERARQTIEATTWDDHGSEFDLTISSAVTEIRLDDAIDNLLRRLADTLKFAKRSGRNRAAIDEGQGPKLLDPPQFNVKGRVVRVGEES